MAAIASSMDNFLNKPIKDLFSLKFDISCSLEDAVTMWEGPLEITLPFVSALLPAVQNGVKAREVISNSIKEFKEKTASILKIVWVTPGLRDTFEKFGKEVKLTID